jgi:transcriptional regulator with XRE-family HTH domain
LTYRDAQSMLLALVRDRIQNGELTERGLARRIGISQPHVHNVLKGVRNLSPEIFDSMLEHFQMSLLDLAAAEDLEASLQGRRLAERAAEAAFLVSPIGPGMRWPTGIDRGRRLPLPFPSLAAPPDLLMAQLAGDPEMSATLAGADVALLDLSEQRRRDVVPDGLYVVSRGGEALLRYIRPGARWWYLASDSNLNRPIEWEELRLPVGERLEAVKARVRWLGRERDRNLPMAQRGRFLYDAISR